MSALLAQAPTLSLFTPVIVTTTLALAVLLVGRIAATQKYKRALRANAGWAPSIPTPEDHPLNRMDTLRRRVLSSELLNPSEVEIDLSLVDLEIVDFSPADSAATTMRVMRV